MKTYGLGKAHKLCSTTAIEQLFNGRESTRSAIAYPLRAVWAENPGRTRGERVQFFISIPKKRLRKAVDRVAMRRKVREAYRLARPEMVPSWPDVAATDETAAQCVAAHEAPAVDLAFIYVADTLEPYHKVERAMSRLLAKIFSSSATSSTPRK